MPFAAVRVRLTAAVPLIAGLTVALARTPILVVVFESQAVAVVPVLLPVTSTATYLPRCVDVGLKVLRVAPEIFTQVDGTVDCAIVTALVQAYHW